MKTRLKLLAFVPFIVLAMFVASVHYLWCIITGSPVGREIAVSADQMGNAALGGDASETISSRAGRARRKGRVWGCVLCGLLDRIDPGHCERFIDTRFITKFLGDEP